MRALFNEDELGYDYYRGAKIFDINSEEEFQDIIDGRNREFFQYIANNRNCHWRYKYEFDGELWEKNEHFESVIIDLIPEVGLYDEGHYLFDTIFNGDQIGYFLPITWNGTTPPLGYHPLDITDRMDAYFSNN